jgi:hypothetical protein
MQVKVTRAFLHKGERQEPGTVLDLPDPIGREIVAMGKAELVAGAPVARSGPMTIETAPALAPKPAKGSKDAGK